MSTKKTVIPRLVVELVSQMNLLNDGITIMEASMQMYEGKSIAFHFTVHINFILSLYNFFLYFCFPMADCREVGV